MMQIGEWNAELEPERIAPGFVLHQRVMIPLEGHAAMFPNGKRYLPTQIYNPAFVTNALCSVRIRAYNCLSMLRVIRDLLVVITNKANADLAVRNFLNCVKLPEKFVAAMVVSRVVHVVDNIVEARTDFLLAVVWSHCDGKAWIKSYIVLSNVKYAAFVIAGGGNRNLEFVEPVHDPFVIGDGERDEIYIANGVLGVLSGRGMELLIRGRNGNPATDITAQELDAPVMREFNGNGKDADMEI